MPFTVFIDESGETGIQKVRGPDTQGASPYFVLGAVVTQRASYLQARQMMRDFREKISKEKWKHATDLSHPDKVLFARSIGALNVRCFAAISRKSTLEDYKEEIEGNSQKFYNKCLCYLLERVCSYLTKFGVSEEELSVVLEHRNHDYDTLIRYLQKVRDRPIYQESKSLRVLNPFSIVTLKKGEDDCLELADFVAHAVYQCVNKTQSNHGIPEPRYFLELSRRFAGDSNGRVIGAGLKCIHSLDQLRLEPEIRSAFLDARVEPPRTP